MNELEVQLRRIDADLRELECSFALVGGLAVSARAEPRLTRDADLAVAVTDDRQAELLVRRLRQRGYAVIAAVEQEATGRLATVRCSRGSPEGVITDLLFASCGIEPEIVIDADRLEVVAGLVLPVASVGHLLAMKLLARDDRNRPLDADDLRALREVASNADWDTASDAVVLIHERGYSRGRDLAESLRILRTDGAY